MFALHHELDEALRARARSAALGIAERLLTEVQEPVRQDVNFERYPCRSMNGTIGYALGFLAFAQVTGDSRFEAAMHAQLKLAAHADGGRIGLFDGISGLRVVASLATAVEPRYAGLVDRCDAFVESVMPKPETLPTWVGDYDLISGWSGVRLARCVNGARGSDRLSELLGWLATDAERCVVPDEGGAPAHWLGVAHGLAGILASLAITLENIPDRLAEPMLACARFLLEQAREFDGERVWPRSVECPRDFEALPTWCYGSPGVAFALLLVAQRLADASLEQFACETLVTLAERPVHARLNGLGICHGAAGVALVYYAAARRKGIASFARACQRYTTHTLDELERTDGHCFAVGNDGRRYDAIGELYGTTGIALALLTMTGEFEERWLRIHALSTSA